MLSDYYENNLADGFGDMNDVRVSVRMRRECQCASLFYQERDRHCLALLLMDDVVIDRRWVTDRTPDGESEG